MQIYDPTGLTFEGSEEDCKRLIAEKGYSSRPPAPGSVVEQIEEVAPPAKKGKK